MISVFRKLYAEYWQHRQEHILRNTILALLDYLGNRTLLAIYRMLSDWRQVKTKIDFRWVMDNQKILLVNLAMGRIGEDNSSFLGSLLITKLQLAAISRIVIPEEQRKDFYLFVDEFQNFVSIETFEDILSEARKYRLYLTFAHQYIDQLDEELRKAIFGNVGIIIAFPVGAENGEFFGKEFYPELPVRT